MNSIFRNIYQILILGMLVLLFSVLFFSNQVLAQRSPFNPNTVPVNGYAWSSNIGWVSFNCRTGGTTGGNICNTSDYKVEILPNGNIVGYAWSSNIGWIRFGGLSGFPNAPGNVAQNAHLALLGGSNFEMRGWARACGGTLSGAGCNNMSSRTDGWDGWISLKGVTPNYGTRFNATGPVTNPVGFAWGSNVVGWMNMTSHMSVVAPVRIDSFGKAPGEVPRVGETPAFDNVRLITYISGINSGTTVPYSITFNGVTQTGNYTATAALGTGNYNPPLVFSNVPAGTPVTGNIRVGNNDNFDTETITLNLAAAPPVITVSARPDLVRAGDRAQIHYTVNSSYDVRCTFVGGGMNETVTISGGATPTSGSRSSQPISSFTRFTVTCGAPGLASVVETLDVSVAPSISEQ